MKNTSEIIKDFITSAQESSPILVIGLVLIIISSLITIANGYALLKDFYLATPLGTRNQQLEKISSLTADADINYFKEKLGQPVFINALDEEKTEFIFYNKNFFVQAITVTGGKVIGYSITTRKKNFNPKITLGPYTEGGSPVEIVLGKTKFQELDEIGKGKITSEFGAHNYYYGEEYNFGNPGLYQTYIFSLNETADLGEEGFPPDLEDPVSIYNYRAQTSINTYTITSPLVGKEDLGVHWLGPSLNQVRVIPDFYNR